MANLYLMLGSAFLGGLILNIMPCVLPVLSLKLFGLIKYAGADGKALRSALLATVGGILFAFMCLAGFTVVAKLLGVLMGWGAQFQQPAFVTFLLVIMVVFACNLWGFFEIRLPGWIMRLVPVSMTYSQRTSEWSESFLTGCVITLLATPCSAPFLATAVTFGLSQSPLVILLLFLCIGLGMSVPYLWVALWPRTLAWLPRPGPWMKYLKLLFGFFFLGTALWLRWVVGRQVYGRALPFLDMGLIMLVIMLWRYPKVRSSVWQKVLLGCSAAVMMGLVGLAQTYRIGKGGWVSPSFSEGSLPWVPYGEAKLSEAVAQGRVVFVDVTSDWCLTCQLFENRLINTPDFRELVQAYNVVLLKADWTTRSNPEIDLLFTRHEHFAIPLFVVYGPREPKGIVLPDFLTFKAIRRAFESVQ